MPVETSRSAVSRMSLSVTLPAKKFQEFQPIGGVAAIVLLAGLAVWAEVKAGSSIKRAAAESRRDEQRADMFSSRTGWVQIELRTVPDSLRAAVRRFVPRILTRDGECCRAEGVVTPGLHGHNDLADLCVRLHVAVRIDNLRKREGLVDARIEGAIGKVIEDILLRD